MNSRVFYLMVFLVFPLLEATVVTVIKNKNITCVLTDEHRNRTVYLNSAPEVQFRKLKSTKIDDYYWINKDWNEYPEDSSLLFYPLMNQRWHDISITNKSNVDIKNGPIGFAVCTKEDFSLVFKDSTMRKHHTFRVKNNQKGRDVCFWRHFQIKSMEDNRIEMEELKYNIGALSRYKLEVGQINFAATNFWLKNSSQASWKMFINESSYLWSNQAKSDKISSIPLTFEHGLKCISFFVSIDKGCAMQFQLECDDGHITNYSKSGFNPPQGDREWRKVNLSIECNTKWATLYFIRKRDLDSNKTSGFWAIDNIQYEDCNEDKWTTDLTGLDLEKGRYSHHCLLLDESENCWIPKDYRKNCEFPCSEMDQGCEGKLNCTCSWEIVGKYCCASNAWDVACKDIICRYCNRNGSEISECQISTSLTMAADKGITYETRSISRSSSSIGTESTQTTSIMATSEAITEHNINNTRSPVTNPQTTKAREATETHNQTLVLALLTITLTIIIIAVICILYISYRLEICPFKQLRLCNSSGSDSGDIPLLALNQTTKITVSDLEMFIKNLLEREEYLKQFNDLPVLCDKSCSIALLKQNTPKNYNHIHIPYDDSRVVLSMLDSEQNDDYINASYIDGYGRPRAYIASQAPKLTTFNDFWRMVWENDVKMIVMSVNFWEMQERNCMEYFPMTLGIKLPFGEIWVKLINVVNFEHHDQRTFQITYRRVDKIVQHFHLKWNPDSNEPLYPNDLVPLVKLMDQYYLENNAPLLVHCNFGIGRSALLILCHFAYKMTETEGFVDFHKLLKQLRTCRPHMIESLDDFILAHMVVSELLRDKERICRQIGPKENVFKLQLEQLNNYKRHDDIIKTLKNIPEKNPVLISGYGKHINFLPETQPNEHSVDRFWNLILNYRIQNIVFLNTTKTQLWPCSFRITDTRVVTIVQTSSNNSNPFYDIINLNIKDDDLSTTTIYESKILFIQFKNWQSIKSTPPIEPFVQLVVDVLTKTQSSSSESPPLLICCRNGITGTGLFIAFTYIVNKFLTELSYDIENAVRILRREKPECVANINQIEFLHMAVNVFSQKFDPYSSPD